MITSLLISRDTFLEIQPATAERPAGVTHLGLETCRMQRRPSRS